MFSRPCCRKCLCVMIMVMLLGLPLIIAGKNNKPTAVILITGCSTGIGRATALKFASRTASDSPSVSQSFKVWATMRSTDRFQYYDTESLSVEEYDTKSAEEKLQLKESFMQIYPNLHVATLDVTNQQQVDAMVASIVEEDGKIDVLINNAGYGLPGVLEMVHIDDAKSMFDVNVWGVVRMIQAVMPYMRSQGEPSLTEAEQFLREHDQGAIYSEGSEFTTAATPPGKAGLSPKKGGYIINLSSTSGIRGMPAFEYYVSSKFALEGLMDSFRYTAAGYGISITNVNPGPVKTEFLSRVETNKNMIQAAEAAGTTLTKSPWRDIPDNSGYLQYMTDRMVAFLNQRTNAKDAQTAQEVAQVIMNLVLMKQASMRVTDVPFNIGTNYGSQNLINSVKKQPTGWTGLYVSILESIPTLSRYLTQQHQHQHYQDKKNEL